MGVGPISAISGGWYLLVGSGVYYGSCFTVAWKYLDILAKFSYNVLQVFRNCLKL